MGFHHASNVGATSADLDREEGVAARAVAEQRGLEVVAVDADAHSRQLPGELIEDRARARIGEEIAEDLLAIDVEIAGPGTASHAVELDALGAVHQDAVRLTDLLEALLGVRVAGIAVGVPLEGQTPIGAADLVFGRFEVHAADPIV